jgi:hypothetical protein
MEKTFTETEERYIKGKLSQFLDVQIRNKLVWSPEQMYHDFVEKISNNIKNKKFVYHYDKNYEPIWCSEKIDKWLISTNAKKKIFGQIQRKYSKDEKVALSKNPIFEQIRFGFKKLNNVCEITYGRKNGKGKLKLKDFENIAFVPWTINHLEKELKNIYSTNLKVCLETFSTSHLEKLFYKYWLNNYYSNKNNPGLIPEFCGTNIWFYYKKDKNEKIYLVNDENYAENYGRIFYVNFRFDFLLINSIRNKAVIIELDGFESHKSPEQQIIDSIKRNVSAEINIPIKIFTRNRITEEIKGCFEEISDYLVNTA